MEDVLTPIRERRKEYEKDIPAVMEILRQGSIKAEAKAAATLNRVKQSMRINYFDDQDYLNEQAKKFAEN